MNWAAIPWDYALIIIVLGAVVPWRGAIRVKQLLARPRLETADRLALYASTIAFQWAAVAIVAWRALARGLHPATLALAFPDPPRTFALSVAFALFLGANQFASLRRLGRLPPARRTFLQQWTEKLMPHNPVESLAFVALVCTVALCEEFLYRGFLFAVFWRWGDSSYLAAALLSSVLFALAHLYQGWKGLTTTFVLGVVFAGVRIWTSSLVPGMAAHLAVDLIAGLAAQRFVRRAAAQQRAAGNSAAQQEENTLS